jgi:hypothetical protein
MLCDNAVACQGPIVATCGYVLMYYCFLFSQALLKMFLYHFTSLAVTKENKKLSYGQFKYEFKGKIALTLDRTTGNTIEQGIPFLMGLWLYALFVDPAEATSLAWWYILFRSIYPICFYIGLPVILVSTVPGYAIIAKLWWGLYIASQAK